MLGFILHLIKIMPISDGMFHSVIDPLTIGLAIGGVKALAGGIQALTAGPKVEQKPYERPKEFDLFAQRAEEQGRQGLPRQTILETQQAAQQAAIFGMRAAQDRRGGLAYAPISQTLLNRANLNLAVQDAAARQRNFVQQQQALLTLGAQKNLEFQTESQRRQNLELQRRARLGAGLQNIMGGIDFAGSMFAMGALGGLSKTPTVATPPSATRFPAVQLPTYSTPAQTPQINALSGIINQPQLPTNMTNTAGSFLFGNPM